MLEVRAVEAAYGPFLALSGVTLTARPGEIVALLGPNGAGKTTLIRCITGLLRPRAGAIRWEGAPLAGVPAHAIVERGIAVVPEGRRLFGAMTVEENLEPALTLSHRAYLLEAGRVAGEGSAAVLLEDPRVRRAYLGPLARSRHRVWPAAAASYPRHATHAANRPRGRRYSDALSATLGPR